MAFSGNYEIVAIFSDKTTIFKDLNYKADTGQHFHKSEKSARWRHRHKIIKTNLKTHISLLLTRPPGSQGCQKMRQDPLNMPGKVWCAKIAPKLNNIWKSPRKHVFFWHFFFNFDGFFEFVSFVGNLSAKGKHFHLWKKNGIFWHPWQPWGRINSGKNIFGVQTATVMQPPIQKLLACYPFLALALLHLRPVGRSENHRGK